MLRLNASPLSEPAPRATSFAILSLRAIFLFAKEMNYEWFRSRAKIISFAARN